MTLLIDASPLQSEHRLRGVGAYVRSLVGAIERLDVRPQYLASTQGDLPDLPPERVTRVYRPHRPAQVYWMYNEVALRAGLARVRPAVFLAPDFNGLVKNPFGLTVSVLHDLTHLKLARTEPARGLSERLDVLRWQVYQAKLQRADRILAISESARNDAVTLLGIDPDRVHVVHHGVDHELFRDVRGTGPYADSPPYLVHLGGRNDNKNQARLLEAFAEVARTEPDLQLYFAGPWSAGDHAWLEREVTRLHLTGRVRHLGYVPHGDLPGLFGNAAAFVFPSLEEGFGLPVLEAMASGAAVITSDRSSLPEVAGDAALLVDPLDPGAIRDAVLAVLHGEGVADGLRARGVARAQGFTWAATARRTMSVLGLA